MKFFTKSIFVFLLIAVSMAIPPRIHAQSPPKEEFMKGRVIEITEKGSQIDINGIKTPYQKLNIEILEGTEKGKKISVENGGVIHINSNQIVEKGDIIVLTKITSTDKKAQYIISDKYRLGYLPYLLGFFLITIILIAGLKGLGSIVGMAISLAIIGVYIVPTIINGGDPLITSILGSLLILISTTYLAHGFSKQTTVALFSTFIALIFTAGLSFAIVSLTKLSGLGNEEAYSLQLSQATSSINLQGLLLGGIIIGTLGALNDITTTQSAAVFEFAKYNKSASFERLFRSGFAVGKEHIVSLVNTLILAYTGSSLALFIYFVLNPSNQPLWVILNSEAIFDEIATMIAGSIGLMSVVPVVTVIAAIVAKQNTKNSS